MRLSLYTHAHIYCIDLSSFARVLTVFAAPIKSPVVNLNLEIATS